jgi:hypothetical protein
LEIVKTTRRTKDHETADEMDIAANLTVGRSRHPWHTCRFRGAAALVASRMQRLDSGRVEAEDGVDVTL